MQLGLASRRLAHTAFAHAHVGAVVVSLVVATYILLEWTRFGRHVYATGGSNSPLLRMLIEQHTLHGDHDT